jgi:short-subunit dehydrogenase
VRELAGRCAIVTGASRGIGTHIARALAGKGVHLALAARSVEGLERTREAAAGAGVRAIAVPTDVSDPSALQTLVERAEAEFGAVDAVVNNAGVETFSAYHLVERDEIDAAVRVNLLAPMLLTQLVLPGMLQRGRGHVVSVSSLAGRVGLACMETYAATKGGLVAFTQSLRATYRGTGVSASVILPGFVAEGGMYARFADGYAAGAANAPPRGRRPRPVPAEAVGRAVVRAIVEDVPELVVTPRPVRPLLAAATLAPGPAERAVERLGLTDLIRRAAGSRSWP